MAKSKKSHQDTPPSTDLLGTAMADFDRHANNPEGVDPVPMPENGGHAHSAAAHLGPSAQPHTKPEGNLRQGSAPGARREPPMVVSRVGKLHRGQ